MVKIDMHVHTWYSRGDGLGSPKDMLRAAQARGLDAIAITDHDTMEGYEDALSVDSPLSVIRGCEVSSSDGHILAYGIESPVPKGMSAEDTICNIHDQGGFAVAAHPMDRRRRGVGDLAFSLPFDAIEARNGHNMSSNRHTEELCIKRMVPMTAGTDAHMAKEVGSCYTEVSSIDTLFEDIAGRRSTLHGKHVSPMVLIEKWIRSHILKQGYSALHPKS